MFDQLYAKTDMGDQIPCHIVSKNDRYIITLAKSDIKPQCKKIFFLEDVFAANAGDHGYYVGNRDFDTYTGFLTYFKQRDDFDYLTPYNIRLINMFGVKCDKFCCIVVPVGMTHDGCVHIYKQCDSYHIGLVYDLEKTDLYEDIAVNVFLLDKNADYVDMAKRYRQYQMEDLGVKSLKERIAERPVLEYVKDCVEIRIRQAWKKAPAEVLEQTLDNEPPVNVAVTFDRVKDIIDELKKQGVEKAQICLVGWNKSGHDGRWPTAFPVEPLLGGEKKLRELIAYAKENGYQIICHSNSTDCYSISDYFDNGSITRKDRNNNPIVDKNVWSGGRMYQICPKVAWEIAQEILPRIADLGFRGCHYIDVMSIVEPRNCFDKRHPVNTGEGIEYDLKIMELAQKLFGGFSSEGTFDFAAKYLDFGLYTSFRRNRECCMDEGIPLWEIVFHGIVMSNAAINTVNYTIKTPRDRLQLIEKCSKPAFYFCSKFMSNGNNWMGAEDIICDTDEHLKFSVSKIKQAYDEYAGFKNLQTEFIENFERPDDNVTVTTYSDGSVVTVDYNKGTYEIRKS